MAYRLNYPADDIFPETRKFPQKELVDGADWSLYDQVQIDSDIERKFVEYKLNEDDQMILFACQRSHSAGFFSASEQEKIALVSDHISQAIFVRRRMQELGRELDSLRATLNRSVFGVVLVDETHRMIWCNTKAEEIFRLQDGLSSRTKFLHTYIASDGDALRLLLNDAISTTTMNGANSGGSIPIGRPSGSRPYHLTVCPISNDGEWGMRTRAVVFVLDPDDPPILPMGAFRKFYGVTAAEARLCRLLASGFTLRESSDRLSVSFNTVRTQLKAIFQKCNVNSQSKLVGLLARTFVSD
ncbi:MAG: hypothetical protein IID59_12160 [Proteobacteria bacterium]|nr:hypothetical protein [Pseudomonadota bacterium]